MRHINDHRARERYLSVAHFFEHNLFNMFGKYTVKTGNLFANKFSPGPGICQLSFSTGTGENWSNRLHIFRLNRENRSFRPGIDDI